MVWENRADRASILGIMFFAGYVACLGVNHVTQLWSEHGQLVVVTKSVIPKLKAHDNCEHRRAENNEAVAKQAIRGALVEDAPIPDAAKIQDACPKK